MSDRKLPENLVNILRNVFISEMEMEQMTVYEFQITNFNMRE